MGSLFSAAGGVLRAIFRAVDHALDSALDGPQYSVFQSDSPSVSESDRGADYDRDRGYSFREVWKEQLVYTEPGGSYSFLCGWGRRPYSVGVPTAEHWEHATPAWMHGRREEILDRLRHWAGMNYTIEEYEPAPQGPKPWVTVIGARYAERPDLGDWLAILMDPNETAPPDLSWPPERRKQFFDDHADKIGGGATPEAAVADLRHKVGQPDLQWGT